MQVNDDYMTIDNATILLDVITPRLITCACRYKIRRVNL